MDNQDRARQVIERKTRSYDWMKDNFYSEWQAVYKSYKCVREMPKDPDGNPDPEQTSVGLPMTHAIIRRTVARATAQIPNLRYRARETEVGELIGRTLMFQWDKGGVQRVQKKHLCQAAMFGISVRPWYWASEQYMRSKRVDPLDPKIDPVTLSQIAQIYSVPERYLLDPEVGHLIRAKLLAKHGRGGLLPVKYPYTGFVGPKCDFLFIGDCYFEPNFQSLQTSGWFVVERRRDLGWMKRVAKLYPQMAAGFEELVSRYPKGSLHMDRQRDTESLREMMRSSIGMKDEAATAGIDDTRQWNIIEQHVPGASPTLTYVAEDNIWIGQVEYPYDLDGKIAFTDLVLVDDLLTGVGDSTARIIRGIQELHDRQVNQRSQLVYNLLRPLVGTSNRELIENPGMIKRYSGFRLVHMRGPNDMWTQGEQAALAAAAVGLNDESSIMRLYQMATGENNMSASANIDPQQARTATGAKIMQAQQDVLTKDLVDMFNETSIKADAEMMFLLNRSELADAVEFEAGPYNRNFASGQDMLREQWVKAEPVHFQIDGEIVSEVGSTLADDDEGRVVKATNLFQAAMSRPDLFNQEKARDEYLIAMGKGRELQQWAAPPPPPPVAEMKANMSVQVKWEFLSEQERIEFLKRAGIEITVEEMPGGPGPLVDPAAAAQEGGPPPGPPMDQPPVGPMQ